MRQHGLDFVSDDCCSPGRWRRVRRAWLPYPEPVNRHRLERVEHTFGNDLDVLPIAAGFSDFLTQEAAVIAKFINLLDLLGDDVVFAFRGGEQSSILDEDFGKRACLTDRRKDCRRCDASVAERGRW
jgi:hypothetical protein